MLLHGYFCSMEKSSQKSVRMKTSSCFIPSYHVFWISNVFPMFLDPFLVGELHHQSWFRWYLPVWPQFLGAISTMIRKQEASPTGRWWLPRELIPQLWPSVVRHSWHQWMVDDRSSPSLFLGCSKQMFDRRPCGLCFFVWRMKYIKSWCVAILACCSTILEV